MFRVQIRVSLTPLATLPPPNKCRNYRRKASPPKPWQQSRTRMINKITLRWKNTGLPRSLQITSSKIPPLRLPWGSSVQKGVGILTLGNSKPKGTFQLCLSTQGQNKTKDKSKVGLFGCHRFKHHWFDSSSQNEHGTRKGTWQIIHKTLHSSALTMGSVPSISMMWKLISLFRFYGLRDEQIKDFSFSPIVKLHIHMRNWGVGETNSLSGEV